MRPPRQPFLVRYHLPVYATLATRIPAGRRKMVRSMYSGGTGRWATLRSTPLCGGPRESPLRARSGPEELLEDGFLQRPAQRLSLPKHRSRCGVLSEGIVFEFGKPPVRIRSHRPLMDGYKPIRTIAVLSLRGSLRYGAVSYRVVDSPRACQFCDDPDTRTRRGPSNKFARRLGDRYGE